MNKNILLKIVSVIASILITIVVAVLFIPKKINKYIEKRKNS